MEKTEIKNGSEIYDTVRELLRLFGADSVQTVEFTDSIASRIRISATIT